MLNALIEFSLRFRWLVITAALGLAVAGSIAVTRLDIDAFPDTTPVQVQINTVAPSLGPEEIEQQITFPIEQVLSGLPKVNTLRSISKFGLSQVVVIFDDGTDIYFARQLVGERLGTVQLPAGLDRPKMGPVSTGLGEVYHYIVSGKGDDFTQLRTIHDWVIRPQMRQVRGVAEVNSWGGFERQYQVRIDPAKLAKYELTFHQVASSIQANNQNVGGGVIDQGSGTLLVHGLGRTTTLEQIRNIQIFAKAGVPVLLGSVADVGIGHEVRRGAVTADGKGEAVLGLGFMTMGENSHEVTWGLKDRLEELKGNLPPGVKVEPVYDRTELIDHVIETVRRNLLEAGLFVITVLFLFLGNLRAAMIVALAIPLSMLCAFSGMLQFGIAASLLSLGAIDFGMVVDSSVVMVENCVRHLADNPEGKSRIEVVRDAAVEVRKPTLFGELIILIVYLPILTLEGIEGKLFRPMALTVIFALLGSMVLSMTLMPALASLILPRRIDHPYRLFANPDPGRNRGEAFQADGPDCDFCPVGIHGPVDDFNAGFGQPDPAKANDRSRSSVSTDGQNGVCPGPQVHHAAETGGNPLRGNRPFHCVFPGGSQSGNRIHSQIVRGGHRVGYRPSRRDQPGRIGEDQHPG